MRDRVALKMIDSQYRNALDYLAASWNGETILAPNEVHKHFLSLPDILPHTVQQVAP